MRSYIRRSPLALLPAVSFAVLIVFALKDRVAIACADSQSALNQVTQRWSGAGSGSDRVPSEASYPPAPGRYRSRRRTGLAREAVTSMGPAEIARQQPVPCVFDNFVWFSDKEIVDEIRKDLPSFDGSAPEVGDSIDKILGALKRILKKKKRPSEVEYTFFSGDGYRYGPEHIFAARDAKVPVCKVVFQNSPPQLEGICSKSRSRSSKRIIRRSSPEVLSTGRRFRSTANTATCAPARSYSRRSWIHRAGTASWSRSRLSRESITSGTRPCARARGRCRV